MRTLIRLGRILIAMISSAASADDRIAAVPSDLTPAYAHPQIVPALNTRAMSVSNDGMRAAYVVQLPVAHPAANADMFLPTGAPTAIAQGARIMIVDLHSRETRRICASQGNDWDPVWSPDGTRLAFYSDRDGETRLWVYERDGENCRRVAERPAKSLPWAHEEPRWSPDGRQIYFSVWPESGRGSPARARVPVAPNSAPAMAPGEIAVYRHDPGTPAAPTGSAPRAARAVDFEESCGFVSYAAASIAVADADGDGPARVLVDADVQSRPGAAHRHFPSPYFRLSASGRWITYFDTACVEPGDAHRMATRLFAMPASGGAPILIADNLRAAIGGDENILDYRWSPVGDELVFTRDGQLWQVAFGAEGPGTPRQARQELGPLSPAIDWYSADGAMVLVGTNPVQTGSGLSPFAKDVDLALVPVAGGDPIRIPVDRHRWAITGVVARNDRALLQPSPTSFRLFGRDKTTGENVVLTFDWRTRATSVTWRGRGRFHDLQVAEDRLIGIYEDFRTPANLFAFSPDLGAPARLTDVAPDLRAAAAAGVEIFDTTIPQFDGTHRTVQTAVLLPEGARRGDRLPAVVWLYPGDDLTEKLASFGAPAIGDPAYLLTSRGYAVVLTNVAIGPGEQRGHVIDEIMDSLLPQVYRAADLGYVDIDRLAVRGHSFGGFATAAVIARTNLFRAAIASAGVYDLGGSYGDTNFVRGQAIDGSDWAEHSQPRLGQPVWDDPRRYIENSPYYLADRIRTPLLIIQGTDDFVGVREGGKLFSALRRLDRPVELALYQGGGHTPAFWEPAQAVDQMARTIEFLRLHLGPGWSGAHR